ncbi:MAG: mechanosensitive ion channel protein [Burkholderiales bacterium 35-55-47]|jgi:small-conductance mechanosensitive channel|uniref:mechanosensitive ion channel family protein n=1 Tax=Limnohabitans sp. TaxID=1907725 RepID=UPI000BD1301F|nr:mechanosensitive ion channel domain-containing protein [Limnohabitans sp.]OYY19913.1 MAG: mechanosensitive ion channel protein [Burkholderiales bacterium 35-55-47]OYZ74476.1 MAG: mechanosensitive ion channel protein [Burkholderiales bacterium 24-55-52]OZB01634.1 MAG: mechanosensitive ion channel protein [Burkholderiales bacterium 39-55-53]HQR86126.1 mechanosensitive ion channel [Limnohabitans sp.]HQS25958.1 mechanosensitive ion channel [Limnohabitans sp.]
MNELQEWLLDLQSPAIALELAGLALCLALAWGLSWVFGRQYTGRASILFGRRLMDGVLLPALALGLTFALKLVLMQFQRVPLLKLVLPVLVSLVMIRLIARVLTAVFPTSRGARVLEQVVSWVAWGLAVLWFTGLWTPLMTELDSWQFMLGKTRISVTHVFEVVFTSGLVLVLALWLSATLEQRVLSRAFDDLSMRKVAANAIRVLLLVIGTLFALSSLGFDLTTLSVIGGALGVGIGFGLQKLAANYVSGFVILLERSLRIGDFVRVDGFEGRVTDIKTRYTLVRAGNGSESVVPNELLLTQRVENLSLESRHLLQTCTFWVGLESNVERVQAELVGAALSVQWVLPSPEPMALLAEVAPQGLKFNLNFWMEDPANGQSLTRSRVNIAALGALRAAGVVLVHSPQEVVLRHPA